jgi:hypothetical protein
MTTTNIKLIPVRVDPALLAEIAVLQQSNSAARAYPGSTEIAVRRAVLK